MAVATIPPFERFYAEHRDAVFGFLARRLGRPAAEDAFQETFLRALRAYDRLEHGRHLRAWIFTIAARVAIDVHRKTPSDTVPLGDEPRVGGLAAGVPRARAPRRGAAADGARGGRAPLRLRPPLLRDRRGARILRGRGATGGVVGDPAAAQKGRTGMKVSRELDRASATRPRGGLLDVAYDMVDTPIGELFVATTRARPLPHLVRPRARARRREPARARVGVARAALGAAGGRDAPAARRVLREAAGREFDLELDLRLARGLLAPRARRARARPVRRGDDVRRARDGAPSVRGRRAQSAR